MGQRAGTDVDLLDAVRRGDRDAYVELYERHVGAARRLARALLRNDADADDVVSEVFASVLAVIERGKGPTDGFRAYLMASVRNECYRAGRRRGRDTSIETNTEALVATGARAAEIDPFAQQDDVAVLQQAFESLSPPFREVLWRTEVEGQSHEEIAEATGSTAPAVAAQALRARRALGGAYLQRHVPNGAPAGRMPPACADTRRQLAGYVRDSIGARGRRRLEAHLLSCAACEEARYELERINQHLRTAPGLPLATGAGVLRLGLKARILGGLMASSAPLVAATGLAVVSTVVPLVIAHRADGADRVAAAAETAGTEVATTSVVRPDPAADPGAGSDRPRPEGGEDPAPPTTTSHPRPDPRPTPRPGGGDDAPTPAPPKKAPTPPRPADAPPATSPPTATVPPVTTPPGTPPAITVVPPVNLPPVTVVPPVSLPPVSLPGVTTPPVSLPPVSLPGITVPSVTVPSVTIPSVTVPSITVPAVTLPAVTVPAVTVPLITQPRITVPPIGG